MSDTTTIDPTAPAVPEQESDILLTEAAAKSIQEIIAQQGLDAGKVYLRVGVKGGGCSGFTYTLDLVEEEPGANDETMSHQGIRIIVDTKSLLYLSGTQIDYKDEMMGSGFVFKNPNATSSCGCGSSFTA
jgi:iron-sulfur cluster assembly accessory protein